MRVDPYPTFRWCRICGWAKGGKDSWDGRACKCGFVFQLRSVRTAALSAKESKP